MDIQTLRSYKSEIINIAHKYGAKNISVFGSVSRGEASSSSDIDLLVDMEKGRSIMDFARLKLNLEDLLGHNVDLVESCSIKPSLRKFIERDIQPL